ncbi:MAG: VOC family protein [Novosphingobium sp.]
MSTTGIDHLNILTDDLEATVAFYEAVLGLTRAESPATAMGMQGAWLRDASGSAIIHLIGNVPGLRLAEGRSPGQSTNAVHHVAFHCDGFDDAKARIAAFGCPFRVNDGNYGLRQIIVSDPNAITVEMNFAIA